MLTRRTVPTRWGAAGLGLCLCVPLLGGGPRLERGIRVRSVPIVNPGFEQLTRLLAPFESSNGARGLGEPVGTYFFTQPTLVSLDDPVGVAGWRTFEPADPGALIYAGVVRTGTVGAVPFLIGSSGDYVAGSRVSPMAQTLDEIVQPGTTYVLRFSAGYGINEFASGVYVSVLGTADRDAFVFQFGQPGVVFLGNTATSSSIQPPPPGVMSSYTVSFTTPNVLPPYLKGKHIVIAMVGSDGLPSMCFDDFELLAIKRSWR